MKTNANQVVSAEEAREAFVSKLRKVADTFERIRDNLQDNKLSPASCAYIDGQLARAIGWLASARSIVITHGSLDHPHFDGDEDIDLDEVWEIVPIPADLDGNGGVA